MCFRHTPTSSAGSSCGGKLSGSFNHCRMRTRVGFDSALKTRARSVGSGSSLTGPSYRHIAIFRYMCLTRYIATSRYTDRSRVMSKRRVAVVVGARGVIGGNLIEHLEATGDWEIVGLSRRGGPDTDRVRHIAVDLLDERDAAGKLGDLRDVTHVFYAAYQDRPSWAELVAPNVAMLVNTVNALEPVAEGLEHISLMQGYKV